MKTYILVLLLFSKISMAQFVKADMQASGLTCSMCNLATQKQLQTLTFIDSIVPDLELNMFHLYFNQTQEIHFDQIKKKVEDAGFFVAELKVTYINNNTYRFASPLLLMEHAALFVKGFKEGQQKQVFKFIDEGFLTAKEFKKYRNVRKEMVLASASPELKLLTTLKLYHVIAE